STLFPYTTLFRSCFFGGISEAPADSHIFRLLSHGAALRRRAWRRVYDPLHRAAREAALEPARLARAIRKLDHGRQHPGARGGSVREILGDGCGHGPCGGNPER